MRPTVVVVAAVLATAAHAQSQIDTQCPNAGTALTLTFPLDLPPSIVAGEAVIEFTIDPNGSVNKVAVISASGSAFAEPAVAAVQQLSCKPRSLPERFSIPLSFSKPSNIPQGRCSNLHEAFGKSDFARQRYFRNGNEVAIVEFTLQASGQVSDLVVLRATSQAYAEEVSRIYLSLVCAASAEPLRIRTSTGILVRSRGAMP